MTYFLLSLVNGDWSAWGSWSVCSQTCGNGSKTQDRSCTNPTPAHGGAECVGSQTKSDYCKIVECQGEFMLL